MDEEMQKLFTKTLTIELDWYFLSTCNEPDVEKYINFRSCSFRTNKLFQINFDFEMVVFLQRQVCSLVEWDKKLKINKTLPPGQWVLQTKVCSGQLECFSQKQRGRKFLCYQEFGLPEKILISMIDIKCWSFITPYGHFYFSHLKSTNT